MTTTDTRSTKDLFRAWRSGDAEAGQVMAQRFADWYYAIATSRLGEKAGREPCEAACARFGEGVVQQSDVRQLVKWAHEVIQEECDKRGSRITDGDDPSAYTASQRPKDLLVKCRRHLGAEVRLLEAVYQGHPENEIARLADALGGMPQGVLKSRYKVKQWLRDNAKVPFDVAPDNPVLDRAPLPLYESGGMASPAEEASFEQWMLSDIDLCKDIAEFAHFAIALRGGLPGEAVQGGQSASSPAAGKDDDDDVGFGTAGKAALGGAALIGIGAAALLAIVVIVAIVMFAL